jgi:hypothetical protein
MRGCARDKACGRIGFPATERAAQTVRPSFQQNTERGKTFHIRDHVLWPIAGSNEGLGLVLENPEHTM